MEAGENSSRGSVHSSKIHTRHLQRSPISTLWVVCFICAQLFHVSELVWMFSVGDRMSRLRNHWDYEELWKRTCRQPDLFPSPHCFFSSGLNPFFLIPFITSFSASCFSSCLLWRFKHLLTLIWLAAWRVVLRSQLLAHEANDERKTLRIVLIRDKEGKMSFFFILCWFFFLFFFLEATAWAPR